MLALTFFLMTLLWEAVVLATWAVTISALRKKLRHECDLLIVGGLIVSGTDKAPSTGHEKPEAGPNDNFPL